MRGLFRAIAHALQTGDLMGAEILQKEIPMSMRAFKRQKIRRWGKYFAGNQHTNVRGTFVRNPKIAAQMNAMHDRWLSRKAAA